MLYLVNFFARKIEAVSKQVEDSRTSSSDTIITCGYFLNQKILNLNDIKDGIWVFPQWLYPYIAFIVLILTKDDVHIFEDEPSAWRKFALNFRKRNVYVSLFKDINTSLIKYLNQFANLRAVSVEDEVSLEIVKNIIDSKEVKVLLCYPSSLWKPELVTNKYGQHILFASWNGGDLSSLKERGIFDLLRIVKSNPQSSATIILRDGQVETINHLIDKMELSKRVNLVDPNGDYGLVRKEFDNANYVMLAPRKPIMKYVPNSIIDGLSLCKPCIITEKLRFAPTVKQHNLGLIINHLKLSKFRLPGKSIYQQMTADCSAWTKKFLIYPYHDSIQRIYKYGA